MSTTFYIYNCKVSDKIVCKYQVFSTPCKQFHGDVMPMFAHIDLFQWLLFITLPPPHPPPPTPHQNSPGELQWLRGYNNGVRVPKGKWFMSLAIVTITSVIPVVMHIQLHKSMPYNTLQMSYCKHLIVIHYVSCYLGQFYINVAKWSKNCTFP